VLIVGLDMTRLSEKGQVVIPNELRKRMGLKEGTRFLVIGLDDMIVLRRLELSKEQVRLKRLLEKSRAKAEKIGFTEKEIDRLIHAYRKVSR
jgi:AbrB family looped-hinge helix DNA binding protein